MPPIYDWMLPGAEGEEPTTIGVYRETMDDRGIPPTAEELEKEGLDPALAESGDWQRMVGSGVRVTYRQGSVKGKMGRV